jgi:3-deoxy-D-manno-octulosonic-acid transferase
LTKIYSYADIAYVGGGFGNPGVHNVLEPATFVFQSLLVPTIRILQKQSHWLTWKCAINNQQELNEAFEKLIRNEDIRHEKDICAAFLYK